MNITTRNFFRLLRAGAFKEKEQIEPMSDWKWQQVYQQAVKHGLAALMYDGVMVCKDQFFMQLQSALFEQWQTTTRQIELQNNDVNQRLCEIYSLLEKLQLHPILSGGQNITMLYDQGSRRTPEEYIDIFFPYETQGKKADQWAIANADSGITESSDGQMRYQWHGTKVRHRHRLLPLTNTIHARTLRIITEQEMRETSPSHVTVSGMSVEQLSPTLQLLCLLLTISNSMLTGSTVLPQLTDVGMFLRKTGDKVDFVKLQSWMERLKMVRMGQLTGELLTALLAFSANEIPFMREEVHTANIEQMAADLLVMNVSHEWHFLQGQQDIFMHAENSSAMFWHVRHSARYFRYYPTESATNFLSAFVHSLSHIEE